MRTTREEDFDSFKLKLSEKLHSKGVDNNALLYDEVDGGVGCADRSVWRKKYYGQKFHLPNRDAEDQREEGGDACPGGGEEEERRKTKRRLLDEDIEALSRDVALAYIIGLQWVLYYYFQGCRSFNWFYPFHYAPLAVDLADELKRRLTPSPTNQPSSQSPASTQDNRHNATADANKPFEVSPLRSVSLSSPRASPLSFIVLPSHAASEARHHSTARDRTQISSSGVRTYTWRNNTQTPVLPRLHPDACLFCVSCPVDLYATLSLPRPELSINMYLRVFSTSRRGGGRFGRLGLWFFSFGHQCGVPTSLCTDVYLQREGERRRRRFSFSLPVVFLSSVFLSSLSVSCVLVCSCRSSSNSGGLSERLSSSWPCSRLTALPACLQRTRPS